MRIRMRNTNLIMESFQHDYDELEGVIARMMTRGWPARMMVNQLDDWPWESASATASLLPTTNPRADDRIFIPSKHQTRLLMVIAFWWKQSNRTHQRRFLPDRQSFQAMLLLQTSPWPNWSPRRIIPLFSQFWLLASLHYSWQYGMQMKHLKWHVWGDSLLRVDIALQISQQDSTTSIDPPCKSFQGSNELTTRTVVRVRRFPWKPRYPTITVVTGDQNSHWWSPAHSPDQWSEPPESIIWSPPPPPRCWNATSSRSDRPPRNLIKQFVLDLFWSIPCSIFDLLDPREACCRAAAI